MMGILEIVALNEVNSVEIFLYLKPIIFFSSDIWDRSNNNQSYYHGAGGDVILDVERGAFESTTSHTADNIPAEDAIITELQTQVQNGEQPRDEVGEPQGWEILKSIVYGGLVESITSLGIVSSAVSSGATPCKFLSSFT